jgi:hypothetical protein
MLAQREPALLIGAVNALLAVAVGFGLPVTPMQVGLINAAVAAILAVIIRQQVVPNAVADKQIEIAKASDISRPTEQIIKEAKESL